MLQPTSSDPERVTPQQGWRTIRHFAYIDRPFRDVRRAIAGAPQQILADQGGGSGDPDGAAVTELHLRRIGFDLARDVRMVLGDIRVGIHSARLPLRWEDATRPGLFPLLDATLEVAPVRAGRRAVTQLGLFGRYRPPFGRLGALADNVAGHRIVVESVERFLDDLVGRFEADLPAPEPGADGDSPAAPDVPGRRRIVLPADGLDRSPHGAAGLALRLLAVPGVLDATVNPTSRLAVIDYDGATCNVRGLLEILEADGLI